MRATACRAMWGSTWSHEVCGCGLPADLKMPLSWHLISTEAQVSMVEMCERQAAWRSAATKGP